MKNKIAIVGFLFFFVLTGCKQKNSDSAEYPTVVPANLWKRFSSDDGKFSVLFPGTPKEKTQVLHSPTEEIEEHTFTIKTDIQTAYGVIYGDIPQKIDLQSLPTFFDKLQFLEASRENGKIVFQVEIKAEQFPGREFEFVAGGKANYSGRVKMILVEQRLYIISTVFLTANPHPADREIFFNSFRFQH